MFDKGSKTNVRIANSTHPVALGPSAIDNSLLHNSGVHSWFEVRAFELCELVSCQINGDWFYVEPNR